MCVSGADGGRYTNLDALKAAASAGQSSVHISNDGTSEITDVPLDTYMQWLPAQAVLVP